ncbi:MAG: fimbrillin family protein [Bacteroides sp.]|nr:fimbrillin family protein [Bacteroides sp.]
MKGKLFIICLLLSSLLLPGCSHGSDDPPLPPVPDNPDQSDNPDEPDNPDPEPVLVPIELYTSLLSRAAVDRFDGTPVGLAVGSNSESIDEQWDALAGERQLSLSSVHYYPTDSSAVYVWGFYPRTMLSMGKAHYELTGNEDILYAEVQSGSLRLPFSEQDKKITFRHLLAQLNISVETGKDFQGNYRLKYFSLDGSAANASLNVLKGEMSFGREPMQVVVYEAPGAGGLLVKAGIEIPLCNILVQPGAEMIMNMVLAKDADSAHDIVFKDIPVDFEGGGSESGLSYNLSVKLPDKLESEEPDNPDVPDPDIPAPPPSKEIQITVTITKWVETTWQGGDLEIFYKNGEVIN